MFVPMVPFASLLLVSESGPWRALAIAAARPVTPCLWMMDRPFDGVFGICVASGTASLFSLIQVIVDCTHIRTPVKRSVHPRMCIPG